MSKKKGSVLRSKYDSTDQEFDDQYAGVMLDANDELVLPPNYNYNKNSVSTRHSSTRDAPDRSTSVLGTSRFEYSNNEDDITMDGDKEDLDLFYKVSQQQSLDFLVLLKFIKLLCNHTGKDITVGLENQYYVNVLESVSTSYHGTHLIRSALNKSKKNKKQLLTGHGDVPEQGYSNRASAAAAGGYFNSEGELDRLFKPPTTTSSVGLSKKKRKRDMGKSTNYFDYSSDVMDVDNDSEEEFDEDGGDDDGGGGGDWVGRKGGEKKKKKDKEVKMEESGDKDSEIKLSELNKILIDITKNIIEDSNRKWLELYHSTTVTSSSSPDSSTLLTQQTELHRRIKSGTMDGLIMAKSIPALDTLRTMYFGHNTVTSNPILIEGLVKGIDFDREIEESKWFQLDKSPTNKYNEDTDDYEDYERPYNDYEEEEEEDDGSSSSDNDDDNHSIGSINGDDIELIKTIEHSGLQEISDLDTCVANVIENVPVVGLGEVLFAGQDIFVTFMVNREQPCYLVMRYLAVIKDNDTGCIHTANKDVFHRLDSSQYNDSSNVVLLKKRNTPLITTKVLFVGVTTMEEGFFIQFSSKVTSTGVELDKANKFKYDISKFKFV